MKELEKILEQDLKEAKESQKKQWSRKANKVRRELLSRYRSTERGAESN